MLAGELALTCDLPRAIAALQQSALAVGDEVALRPLGGGSFGIVAVLPRRSTLSRPDPHVAGRERVLAANVDLVVAVVSGREPPLRPRLIDRILLAAARGGARTLIALNKVDLLQPEQEAQAAELLQPYRDLGAPIVACSARTGAGLEDLRRLLSGATAVFAGHSGVGKSSLIAALCPGDAPAIGEVSGRSGKGRHTTSASRLYRLPGGGCIIDTPGVREFGLWRIGPEDLPDYFPEFAGPAAACRFADCRHVREPDCGVRRAVRDGLIHRARYETYCRLLGEEPANAEGAPDADHAAGWFACAHCGAQTPTRLAGSAHRNHCPSCLWSKHVDHRPGDRSACCDGLMEPVAVWVRKGGEWAIIHRCTICGVLRSNRIAADDNEALLLSLAVRPLSMPAFPLDRLAGLDRRIRGDAEG